LQSEVLLCRVPSPPFVRTVLLPAKEIFEDSSFRRPEESRTGVHIREEKRTGRILDEIQGTLLGVDPLESVSRIVSFDLVQRFLDPDVINQTVESLRVCPVVLPTLERLMDRSV